MNLGINFANEMRGILLQSKHSIAKLDLHKNNLSDAGVKALCEAIKKSKSLVHLNLSSNEINNEGLIALFQTLQMN